MDECGSDLGNHWYPCRLHAVQESLGEVKHAQKVNTGQVHKNVLPCILTDFLILADRAQYRLSKEEEYEKRDEDDRVDDSGTIKVHSAEVHLTSYISLSNEGLHGSIHANYYVKHQAF